MIQACLEQPRSNHFESLLPLRLGLCPMLFVLVSHNYSNFTVLSFSSSLTDLVGSRIKQTSFKITIDEMKKLRGEGRGRAKKHQGGTSAAYDGPLFSTSRKDPIALYASEQEQSDLLKWENMYRQGR